MRAKRACLCLDSGEIPRQFRDLLTRVGFPTSNDVNP
jgi:hypothetical protein